MFLATTTTTTIFGTCNDIAADVCDYCPSSISCGSLNYESILNEDRDSNVDVVIRIEESKEVAEFLLGNFIVVLDNLDQQLFSHW